MLQYLHYRHSIRLKEYDYRRNGLYFVTVCVQNMECVFGEISNGEMVLNEYGKIIQTVWNKLPQHYTNVQLGEFVVMPNHIHGIIVITDTDTPVGAGFKPAHLSCRFATVGAGWGERAGLNPAPTHGLTEIVRALKTFSARQINKIRGTVGERLWQRNYYEHIIRNADEHHKIATYILNNPANWLNDKFSK
jgi:REP element-mobilizing transposase RayT